MFKSKIHRATVTDSALHYKGGLTLDETLRKAADVLRFEHIHVYNITNGHRFETYVMRGEKGSGIICVNGVAAHLTRKGDLVIIANTNAFNFLTRGPLTLSSPRWGEGWGEGQSR